MSIDFGKSTHQRLAWYQQAKFGLFIHWGAYSAGGVEASWPIMAPDLSEAMFGTQTRIGEAEYTALPAHFNPAHFDAEAWVQAAQEAGMRLGFYYSPPDMHHPGYRDTTRPATHNWLGEPRRKEWAGYLDYMESHIRKLLTGYGEVSILWFDGLANHAKYDPLRFHKLIHALSPHTLINDRLGDGYDNKWSPGNVGPVGNLLEIEAFPGTVQSASPLTSSGKMGDNKSPVAFCLQAGRLEIDLPAQAPDPDVSVVELDIDSSEAGWNTYSSKQPKTFAPEKYVQMQTRALVSVLAICSGLGEENRR